MITKDWVVLMLWTFKPVTYMIWITNMMKLKHIRSLWNEYRKKMKVFRNPCHLKTHSGALDIGVTHRTSTEWYMLGLWIRQEGYGLTFEASWSFVPKSEYKAFQIFTLLSYTCGKSDTVRAWMRKDLASIFTQRWWAIIKLLLHRKQKFPPVLHTSVRIPYLDSHQTVKTKSNLVVLSGDPNKGSCKRPWYILTTRLVLHIQSFSNGSRETQHHVLLCDKPEALEENAKESMLLRSLIICLGC